MEETTQNQQLARQALLALINGLHNNDTKLWTVLKKILGSSVQPQFEKELYANQLRLKTLNYERCLLEKELEKLI